MKVLVVGTGGALGGSGITTVADQMTLMLAEMGHEPTRLVAGDRRRARPNRLNLVNVLAVLAEAVAVAQAARATRPGVVWLHTFGVPTLPAIRTLAQVFAVRTVRRRIVVQMHAFDLAGQVERGGLVLRTVLRVVGRLSQRLIALQEVDADALRPYAEVSIIPNWVDVSAEPTPLPPGPPFTVVFVGGLVERKGVPQLLEAMRLLENVPLQLRIAGGAGDDGPEAAAAMRRSAHDLTESDRVVFLGELEAGAVRQELARAHLFVLPSRAEGMPMAMLEALAAGRAVLVADAGKMVEVVREHECGSVLASREPADIAAALRACIRDWARLAAQGANGRQAAEKLQSDAAEQIARVVEGPGNPGVSSVAEAAG